MDLSPTAEGVCSTCASGLAGIASEFKKLKHQGTELKKRKTKMLTHPHTRVSFSDGVLDGGKRNKWAYV